MNALYRLFYAAFVGASIRTPAPRGPRLMKTDRTHCRRPIYRPIRINRNKYKPHQGAQEIARRAAR